MLLLDVSVLVYAFREDAHDHRRYREWLEEIVAGGEDFAVSNIVFSSFLRLVTNPHIFRPGTPWPRAIAFVEALRAHPRYVRIEPGPRQWEIFLRLCEAVEASGNLVSDAYLAAIAVEHGCEWVSADGHFARFPGLRWRKPLR